MDSAAARADACYYSSFTSAYFRLAGLDPAWVGSLHDTVAAGAHAPFAEQMAARGRLCATPGMDALLQKLSVHDRPRRAQGKIMNLKLAVEVDDLVRTLPPREVTVINASAETRTSCPSEPPGAQRRARHPPGHAPVRHANHSFAVHRRRDDDKRNLPSLWQAPRERAP